MSTSSARQDSLLAAIQRKTSISSPAAQPAPAASSPAPAAPAPSKKVGKPVQFWLHDADRKLIRELSAWLAGQGIRPTDSMVVRAALRMAKPGPGLLDCYRSASSLDGRLKPR